VNVEFAAADGWPIGGILEAVDGDLGAVLVPGSRHERDAYNSLAAPLAGAGIASLRIDVRGRGSSLGTTRYARMGPGQRRRVALDVAAALDHLGKQRMAVVAEQDTAADAVAAAVADERVAAVVLWSPRRGRRIAAALATRPLPVLTLVSSEDHEGRAAATGTIEVFDGLGFGTTMMSTRQFEHPDEEPLESIATAWLVDVLRPSTGPR
jgi:pimeloyl-ACP methyl ester carboxylesterase